VKCRCSSPETPPGMTLYLFSLPKEPLSIFQWEFGQPRCFFFFPLHHVAVWTLPRPPYFISPISELVPFFFLDPTFQCPSPPAPLSSFWCCGVGAGFTFGPPRDRLPHPPAVFPADPFGLVTPQRGLGTPRPDPPAGPLLTAPASSPAIVSPFPV